MLDSDSYAIGAHVTGFGKTCRAIWGLSEEVTFIRLTFTRHMAVILIVHVRGDLPAT